MAKKLTKNKIKKAISRVITYMLSEDLKRKLIGRKDGFVFNIPEQIKWIDKESGGKFHSKHYSPMVYNEFPILHRGTIEYEDFWDEQDDRCLNGYAPKVNGIQYPRITGPHYFYLNHFKIMMLMEGAKKKTLEYPYYRALDHMLFLELEKAEKDGYGIIVGKARRMGLSYVGSVMVLWNMLFFKDNSVAVGAGKEDKAIALFKKVVKSLENIREEYRVSYRKKKDEMNFAYSITEHKVRKDKGIGSLLDVKTFFSDPSAFEGGSYSFFIFEEIGIHDNLILSYKASEPCFTDGATQFGVPFLFGTGGVVDKGSKDFMIMYQNPGSYNLKKLFIPKYMYYPGSDPEDENADKLDIGANFFDVRTGLTDEEAALKHILKRRLLARKSQEGYIKEVQSNPIKESDIFLKTSGGLLNRIALSAQREKLYNKENEYETIQGRYEWKDTDAIRPLLGRCRNTKEKALLRIKYGIGVEFVPDIDGHITHLDGIKPINHPGRVFNPDIQGTDSYDEETVVESGSLGCSMVYRLFSDLSTDYDMPIAVLSERGDGTNEDTFFDNCVKMSVYWKSENLIEYTKIAVLNHYRDIGAEDYLRRNPELSPDMVTNKGRQQYGVRMTSGANGFKSLLTKFLKMEVKENVQNIHFEKVLDDLIDYGDVNTDIAMAYGICMIHKADLFEMVTADLDDDVSEGDVLMDWVSVTSDDQGKIQYEAYVNNEEDRLEKFDPRLHLTGIDREEYMAERERLKRHRMQQKEKLEQDFKDRENSIDPLRSTITELIKQKKDAISREI